MAKVIITIFSYSLLFIFDFLGFYQSRDKKKIVFYSTLFFTTFILSLLISLGIRIPSPALALKKLLFD